MGIRNIWQNDFYNESPVSKWAWEIDFSSFLPKDTIEAYKLDKYLKTLNKAIVSCVWGKREMSIVNTYFGGIQANFPGRIQNAGEINIKFNENQSMIVSQTLEILFNLQSHDQNYFKNEKEQGYTYDPVSMNYIKENVIRLKVKKPIYNIGNEELDDNNVIALLEFHNCFIKGINEEELSYENTEDVLTRTVSISYDYMIYGKVTETLDQNKAAYEEEMRRQEELRQAEEEALEIEETLKNENEIAAQMNEEIDKIKQDSEEKLEELAKRNDYDNLMKEAKDLNKSSDSGTSKMSSARLEEYRLAKLYEEGGFEALEKERIKNKENDIIGIRGEIDTEEEARNYIIERTMNVGENRKAKTEWSEEQKEHILRETLMRVDNISEERNNNFERQKAATRARIAPEDLSKNNPEVNADEQAYKSYKRSETERNDVLKRQSSLESAANASEIAYQRAGANAQSLREASRARMSEQQRGEEYVSQQSYLASQKISAQREDLSNEQKAKEDKG